MASNFPSSLDDAVTLGGAFSNTSVVTNPLTQIDATYRVNIKDATLAVEARLGVTNSTVPTSLSWATLSVGGVDNQGLRFAASSAAWPGLVAEAGIFINSATGYPNFHYQGDALSTFYPLTVAGSVVSLQNAYDTSGVLATSGTDDLAFTVTAGDDFTIACAAGAATKLTGASSTLTTGLLDIDFTSIGASGMMAVNVRTENATNNQQFGSVVASVDNTGDLADSEVVYCYGADITMGGDGPAAPSRAFGAGFYANGSSFTGSDVFTTVGLMARSGYDYGVWSDAALRVNIAGTGTGFELDSDPAAFVGAVTLANAATDARSAFLTCYEGTITTPVVARFNILSTGETSIVAATATNAALRIKQTSTGDLIHCTDPSSVSLFRVEDDGVVYCTATAAAAVATLTLSHGAATEPFIDLDGTYNATAANGNVTDEDAGGAVVGPGTTTWTYNGMARVSIQVGGGGITAGDYWVALYS